MATQTQNYKLHKFELKDAPADITAINASMDIIDTQLKSLADGKFDKTGGTISGNLVVNGSTTLKKLTASELDLNGNADVSGTLKVTGATTLTGKLTANGGVTTKALTATSLDLNGNGDVSGSLTVHGDLNAQGGLNVTDITATGSTTLVNLNAANITATGTLKVNGATTLTGALAANGGVTTKKVTATELDLNGNGDVSGNLNVGGLLQVTGNVSATGTIQVRNARPFAVTIPQISDITQPPSSEVQAWPVSVYDAQAHAIAMLKYIKKSSGESQWLLADIDYSDGDQHWAQLTIGHKADGTAYLRSDVPAEFGGGLGVSGGLFTVSGSGEVSGNWKVEGNVETTVLKGSMLQIEGSGGAHIVRRVKNYTKGQAPSNSMYIGHFLYGSGVTNQTSNRVAGNEIAISNLGNVTYTFSCYEPVAGSTKATTLRLGYGDESWININADNVNLASTVNINGVLNVNNDVSVAGWIKLTGNIESNGTQPFRLASGSLDVKTAPTSNIQLWPLGVYDKNGLAAAYIKYNKYTDGRQNIQLLSRYAREDDTYELAGLTVGHHADGTFYTDVPHPVTESNDNSIATTAWVTQKVNSNKLTIGNPVSQGTPKSGSCTKNTIVYINSSGAVHDVKVNGTTVANTSGYHGEQPQCVTILVPAGGSWSIGGTSNGSLTSVLYMEIN